jgi:signal peptide peptidase SppA
VTRESRYPHVVRAVRETPWAILEETYWTILQLVDVRASGGTLTHDEIQARIGAGPARRDYEVVNGNVAVIPIYGVITPKADLMSEMSGGTSVERISQTFAAALADDGIRGIVLDIDSPGGSVDGIPELAAQIRGARGTKPILAQANYRAASAAYWLGAQADEFFAAPSADVGSVGVFAAHNDVSAALEQDGIKVTLISAGKYKVEGNPFEPLSDEAIAAIQESVDEMYGMFVADLAKGRGVGVDTVRSDFGQGRMLSAKKALDAGMVDGVDTIENTIRRAGRKAGQPASQAATSAEPALQAGDTTSFSDDLDAAHRAIDVVVTRGETLRVLTATKRDQLAHLAERLGALVESTTAEPKREPDDESIDLEAEFLAIATRRRLETATT